MQTESSTDQPPAGAARTAEAPAATDRQQVRALDPRAWRRLSRSPKDMAISMLVLLVPIFIALVVYRFVGGERPTVVDPSSAFEAVRAAKQFTVLAPAGLGGGWRPVTYQVDRAGDGVTLRVGYLSPDGHSVQLVESGRPASALLTDELGAGATGSGVTDIGGVSWQVLAAVGGDDALVRTDDSRTILVVGDGGVAELKDLAGHLTI